ncbi:MAG: hypothetical protein GWN01_14600 [Nitrosopumilaceae archaeon]|nr:hypothetical protein [Nitrosopumilaceae archaeon]NIU88478.1 hypothetical protein [Nitrosopumilaceae archaeon]NIX62687.1 hypothetical protein [Nitrosopumilaceae archaeon]
MEKVDYLKIVRRPLVVPPIGEHPWQMHMYCLDENKNKWSVILTGDLVKTIYRKCKQGVTLRCKGEHKGVLEEMKMKLFTATSLNIHKGGD